MVALCVVFLVGLALAIPNPIYGYCEEMGYTYENETCFFGDGNNCSLQGFYNGTCGQEYVVNVSCAEAGQAQGIVRECCNGLDSVSKFQIIDGECIPLVGGYGICTDCGNGVCEDWEDTCNCGDDCETEENGTDTNQSEAEKVCCKVTQTKQNSDEQIIKYQLIETDSCVNPEGNSNTQKEIVDGSFCENQKIKEAIQERNRIRFETRTGQECANDCICTGRVMKCPLEGGSREMTVYTGSGNTIVQVKGVNMSTNVELYHHNKTLYGVFKNKTKEVKILPDQAQEKIQERIRVRIEKYSNITLNEDGYYEVQLQKRTRLFFLIPVREHVRAEVEAETGDVKIRNPWWGFLSRDVEK